MQVIDKLSKRDLSSARVYREFGENQVRVLNARNSAWLSKQSFRAKAPNIRYTHLHIEGYSFPEGSEGSDKDYVKWDLKFEKEVSGRLCSGWLERVVGEALLHLGRRGRLPELEEHNSAPGIFSTADYIEIRVSNDSSGWVKQGSFPKGVRIKRGLAEGSPSKTVLIPVYTDIKRDALAGFKAAEEWARFRTMAVACSDYVLGELRKEVKARESMPRDSVKDNGARYNSGELIRSRIEVSVPLTFQFMPNTMKTEGAECYLKQHYMPGVLEGALALELEKGVHANYGTKDEICPVRYITGFPVEIRTTGKKGEFDAFFKFTLHGCLGGVENKKAQEVIQENLRRYFTVVAIDKSSLQFVITIPNAHRAYQAILEGKTNTDIHNPAGAILDAVREVYSLSGYWNDFQVPTLEAQYAALADTAATAHFGALENKLKILASMGNMKRQ